MCSARGCRGSTAANACITFRCSSKTRRHTAPELRPLRGALAKATIAASPLLVLVLTAPALPSPAPSPTPSGPTPTPSATSGPPSGELQVTKSDPSGVPLANATFKVTSASDPSFIMQMTTSDPSGSVTLANLPPGMYCLEEIAVPQGYLVQPTYAPDRCVLVKSDPTGHDNPTTV